MVMNDEEASRLITLLTSLRTGLITMQRDIEKEIKKLCAKHSLSVSFDKVEDEPKKKGDRTR